ncbi:hypothetical protein [Haliangium sp.]|uniref:hypothetical protein n=1 Tax=Haliangium sp. TaxID=2663208 RepID=UPI003D0ADF4B
MKWIELIRVRSSAAALRDAMPALQDRIAELEQSATGAEIFFMRHALYDGDLAVVVVWKHGGTPNKSREALLLAERLQRLGPIDHAVWIPAEACEASCASPDQPA